MARETELYKDKIEVSLDGRQIFYLFFGGAVIVGMVFVLGVMVGRRVEARGHVERAHVEATVDPLAALDRLEGGSGLSFQGALRGGETHTSDVEKQIEQMAPKAAEPKVEKKAEPKPEAKSEEPKPEPKAEPKLEAKDDEPKPEKKAEKKDDKKSDEPKSEKSEKKQKFTLQLSSFKDKDEAQAFLDQIKAQGFSASMTKADVDGKQYYRVRMGSYSSVDAANDAKAEFEKSSKKSALVTKL
ncbi:MAG TPA: SPOR domain-containing protein [Kofleriaceae bacterium]|nr:SPOR domain-containing protein [Kofleriaceae bacterium]